MQEALTDQLEIKVTEAEAAKIDTQRPRSTPFKYYIHDSVDHFRIELHGELTRSNIGELAGCWSTAKATVSGRKIILDVRRLQSVDDMGRQWLAQMTAAGAMYVVKSHSTKGLTLADHWTPGKIETPRTTTFFCRIYAALRSLLGLGKSKAADDLEAPWLGCGN